MSKPKDPPRIETLAPARNFAIPLAERIRALGGAPAYVTRRRTIEDLEAALIARLRELIAQGETAVETVLKKRAFHAKVAHLNKLIESHNRFFPAEANLPMDPRSGVSLERGAPWRPLEPRPIASLLELARREDAGA